MDTTFAIWYNGEARALHLAVDKGTKKVLYGWFDEQETTRAYYIMLMNIIVRYGIPPKIKTDKRGTFSINNVKTKSKLNTTQFGRICDDLVDIETGEILSYARNTECTVIITYDCSLLCSIEDQICILSEVKAPEKKVYQKTTKSIEEINRSKAHKPSADHPWRNIKSCVLAFYLNFVSLLWLLHFVVFLNAQ